MSNQDAKLKRAGAAHARAYREKSWHGAKTVREVHEQRAAEGKRTVPCGVDGCTNRVPCNAIDPPIKPRCPNHKGKPRDHLTKMPERVEGLCNWPLKGHGPKKLCRRPQEREGGGCCIHRGPPPSLDDIIIV